MLFGHLGLADEAAWSHPDLQPSDQCLLPLWDPVSYLLPVPVINVGALLAQILHDPAIISLAELRHNELNVPRDPAPPFLAARRLEAPGSPHHADSHYSPRLWLRPGQVTPLIWILLVYPCMITPCSISRRECSRTKTVTFEARAPPSSLGGLVQSDLAAAALLLAASVYAASASSPSRWVLAALIACAVALGVASLTAVTVERLVVMPSMGVVVESFARCGNKRGKTFVDMQQIAAVFIHEGLTANDIR